MTAPAFGLVLPSSTGTGVPDPESIWKLAAAVESSSLDRLWVSDHLLWWLPMHESLSLLAGLAARTTRVSIGPAVLLLAMRDPIITAKALATIDLLSEGRLVVGVGIGGEFPPEWEAVGVDRRTRVSRTEEMIEALKGLWGPGPFGYRGRRITFEPVDLYPKPARPPPIWIGGRVEASVERAARLADGWMGIFLTPERYASRIDLLKKTAAARGRDPDTIKPSLYVWTCIAERGDDAREVASTLLPAFYNVPYSRLEKYAVVGDPAECSARLRAYVQAGCRDFAVAPIPHGEPEDFVRMISEEILPTISL
ncbi:MAG: LLM class flavin-dependent oxidoreductase [Actinomycetota bacterium]